MVTVGGIKKVGAEASVVAASQAMEMPRATDCHQLMKQATRR